MATQKKGKKGGELANYTPNAVKVIHYGEEVVVPTTRHENAFVNMLMAATMRNTIFSAMKKWKDANVTPTPKELADLAKAAKDIAAFSAEMYQPEPDTPQRAPDEKQGGSEQDQKVNFDNLIANPKKPDGAIDIEAEAKPNEPRDSSETNSERSGDGASEEPAATP